MADGGGVFLLSKRNINKGWEWEGGIPFLLASLCSLVGPLLLAHRCYDSLGS